MLQMSRHTQQIQTAAVHSTTKRVDRYLFNNFNFARGYQNIFISENLTPKSRKWHFRDSSFKNFLEKHTPDPSRILRGSTCALGTRTSGGVFETGAPCHNVSK